MCARLKNRILAESSNGATMVEFALTFPFLILLLMGIFDLGWAVYANNTIALAAREGARMAIITGTMDADIKAHVESTAQGLNLADGQISISPSRSPGNSVSVTVNYTYTPLTPLIANIIGGSGHLSLSSQATMIVE